jgi:hypothetical protein
MLSGILLSLHPLNLLNAPHDSDTLRIAKEIKGKLGPHLNGLQRLATHAVKDQLNGFHVTIFSLLNDCPDDVLAVREAVFRPLLEKTCECFSHPVVERPDFGRYTTPVYTRIALREGPARPTPSLGCWLFCANRNWLHRVKIYNT